MSLDLISNDNEAFRGYAFWVGILILKTLAMSILTAMKRMKNKTFANPEDTKMYKVKVNLNDDEVERVRRAHLNDLENVLPLAIAGFFYVLTNPPVAMALSLFRAAALFRIVHTVVYAVYPLPQPSRAIAFFVPLVITGYMSVKSILYFL